MKKYRFSSILLVLATLMSLLCLPAGAAEDELDLYCTNAVLIDVNYDEVLYEKNAYDKAYPASMTKVMTALLTLEAIEAGSLTLDTMVTVSENAARKDFSNESTANLKAGEQMSVKDLLYCLMLPSANDAAKALAEHVGGSVDTFAQMMNDRAAQLGCKNTHFINPHGLHNTQHYTSAYDVALMFMAAMEHELFLEIIATPSYTAAATNISAERFFFNTNGLISNLYYSGHTYDKCIGGKTGSTDEAGRCLVAAAEDGDKLMVSVIMGSGPIEQPDGRSRQGQFDESKRLLEYGFNNFRRVTISRPDEPVDKVAVTLSRDADEVMVKPIGSVTLTLPKSINENDIQSEITLYSDTVEAPVEEGQVLGTMRLFYEDQDYGELELVAVTGVERSELLYKKMLFVNFMEEYGVRLAVGIVAAIVLILLLVFLLRRKRRRYRSTRHRGSHRNYRGSRR
ncbi:MAG: D-alanyl-D-alanine carboxypeptidase [Clostridium sp.]|nr:D-alanyl-D-alanine carboxypeptidase [Clostridium sp.]